MTRSLSSILALAVVSLPAFSSAQAVEKPWMVRLRVLNMAPANKSDAFTALATNFPADAIHLSTKTFPEVDFTYYFSEKFSAELVLTYPQRHDVTLKGVGNIGTVDHLPPCLLAQYHFDVPSMAVKPYVGLGVNFTRITHARLAVAQTPLEIERNSVGLAFQLGADYAIGKNLFLNVDYKRVGIAFDVKAGGNKLSTASVDPNLFSIGVGMRF